MTDWTDARQRVERALEHMDRAGGDNCGMDECPWCHAQGERERDDKWHQPDCELVDARAALLQLLAQVDQVTAEREKYQIAASVLCGAHIGVPQAACPVCQRDKAEADAAALVSRLGEAHPCRLNPDGRRCGICEGCKEFCRAQPLGEAPVSREDREQATCATCVSLERRTVEGQYLCNQDASPVVDLYESDLTRFGCSCHALKLDPTPTEDK